MDQNGSFSGTSGTGSDAGTEPAASARSRSVFDAGLVPPGDDAADGPATYQDGFGGTLFLQSVGVLDEEHTGAALSRMDHLIRWAQAQQAKLLNRMETIYRDEILFASGKLEPGLAFSLAAEEAATILGLPTGTGKLLMSQAGTLCGIHTATLAKLEAGGISYGHVQTVLEQSVGVPAGELSGFETELLALSDEQTRARFQAKARRLRENRYPETIVERQLTAFEQRRVYLQPDTDGMSWLSAFLPAQKAQAIFIQLTTAARGEQSDGDPRTVDQLRADILEDLLAAGRAEATGDGGKQAGSKGAGGKGPGGKGAGKATARSRARAEILVLISAETLFGADDQPAELHGYGPISPETARRMAREAAKWTPVERDPDTEEILRVGRRRKVPAGLQRWLRARDGTCRFPGCRSNAVISEIDHTKPWAQGGRTDHDNLEYLCRRHHMFKTKGFWKACQPEPGIIEWTSPGGRAYRTEPHLTYPSEPHRQAQEAEQIPATATATTTTTTTVWYAGSIRGGPEGQSDDDYSGDPPPF